MALIRDEKTWYVGGLRASLMGEPPHDQSGSAYATRAVLGTNTIWEQITPDQPGLQAQVPRPGEQTPLWPEQSKSLLHFVGAGGGGGGAGGPPAGVPQGGRWLPFGRSLRQPGHGP